MNPPKYVTCPTVAKRLAIHPSKVRNWIASGELVAVDISEKRGGRPRWRISEADLEAFLLRRSAPAPAPATRRRRKVDASVTKYF